MIRKITIGLDYKQGMHYQVGQWFGSGQVETIRVVDTGFQIYIRQENGEVALWKHITPTVPVIVEYDLQGF